MSRYKVVPESQSNHCCFEATVVDTTKPNPSYPGMFLSVCESFDEADADLVCAALNAQAEGLAALRRLSDAWLSKAGPRGNPHDEAKSAAFWACAKELRDWIDSQEVQP